MVSPPLSNESGTDYGRINVDWFQCRDCLVSDGLNSIPEEWRTPCAECLDQVADEEAGE
jgi:hypothetical protein